MKNIITILLFTLFLVSCTDPYKLQTNTFDEALVVEATITNEMKRQEIKVSKTYRLEEEGPTLISDANVTVTDDIGNSYDFTFEDGKYLSNTEFQAVHGRSYSLNITTAEGRSYSSTTETLTTASPITNVTATSEVVNNEKGVQIRVSSYDPTGTSKYYRYRYDETYKIIAPMWADKFVMLSHDLQVGYSIYDYIQIHPRTTEAQVCFSTQSSDKIIVATTSDLSEDRIDNFPVRFISAKDPIIMHRYSINVVQYVQSFASYTFYKTLAQMAGTGGNILSQNQPGFFSGNIFSDNNPDEKVIGFFEVSSVSEQRIFFNFQDLLTGELPPDYFVDCEPVTLNANDFAPNGSKEGVILRSNIDAGTLLYYEHSGSLYTMVPKECGDCTTFSSNIVPSFWID